MKKIAKLLTGIILIASGFIACEEDDTLVASKSQLKHDPNKTIMQYLEDSNECDSVVRMIKVAELESTLNQGELTMFVPTNESVISYMYVKGIKSLSELTEDQAADLVKMYVIDEKIPFKLSEADAKVKYENLKGDHMMITFAKDTWNSVNGQGPLYTSVTYVFDEANDKKNKKEVVRTNNIQLKNGICLYPKKQPCPQFY